jgi:hypothetical protein
MVAVHGEAVAVSGSIEVVQRMASDDGCDDSERQKRRERN